MQQRGFSVRGVNLALHTIRLQNYNSIIMMSNSDISPDNKVINNLYLHFYMDVLLKRPTRGLTNIYSTEYIFNTQYLKIHLLFIFSQFQTHLSFTFRYSLAHFMFILYRVYFISF